MPKIVDHDKRREEIAEALWRVMAREGAEGVSIRSVAAEIGHSRGIIEHYFTSREEMLRHACRLACDRTLAQVRETRAKLAGREAMRAVLLSGSQYGGDHAVSTGVWLGVLSFVLRDPALTAEYVRFSDEMRDIISSIIAEAIASGETSSRIDPDVMGRYVLALNLGMTVEMQVRPERYASEAVEAEVEDFLNGHAGRAQAGLQDEGASIA